MSDTTNDLHGVLDGYSKFLREKDLAPAVHQPHLVGGKFDRHVLSYNHLAWYPGEENRNPPPNGAIGVGMNIAIADVNGDGRNDIVVSSKAGLYVFYNEGDAPRRWTKPRLPPQTAYPTWRDWHDKTK